MALRLNRQAFPRRNMSILCLLAKRLELWRFQNETRLSQGVVVINTLLSLLRDLDALGSAGWGHGVPRGQSDQSVTSAGCTGASHGPVAEPHIQGRVSSVPAHSTWSFLGVFRRSFCSRNSMGLTISSSRLENS